MKPSVFLFGYLLCGLVVPSLAETPHRGRVKVAAAQILTDTHDLQRNQRKIIDAIR